jgi:nucleoside phosphorylase
MAAGEIGRRDIDRGGKDAPARIGWIGRASYNGLIITTGTSGAIGSKLKLGDVVVASDCVLKCATVFKNLNGTRVSSNVRLPSADFRSAAEKLLGANSGKLPSSDLPKIYWDGGQLGQRITVVTVDFFAFDDVQNTYGLQGLGSVVETNDAALGLACVRMAKPPPWLAIRNIADTQVAGSSLKANSTLAAQMYNAYGFWTSVEGAVAVWAAIDGYPQ